MLKTSPTRPSSASTLLALGLEAYGRADFGEALELLAKAHSYALHHQDPATQIQALIAQGKAHRDLGAVEQAGHCLDQAVELAQRWGEEGLEADALNQRASIHHIGGAYAFALRDLEGALAKARGLDDPRRSTHTLINMGILHTKLGDYPSALRALREAHVLISSRLQDPTTEAQCLINLALLYQETDEEAKALETSQSVIQVLQGMDNPRLEVISRVNLGDLYKRLGRMDLASACFELALEQARAIGMVKVEVAALDGLGQVRLSNGQAGAALELHQQALQRSRETLDREGEIASLINMGRVLLLGRPAEAIKPLQSALQLAQETEAKKAVMESHQLLSWVYEKLGDLAQALEHFRSYHALEVEVLKHEAAHKNRQLAIQFDLERAHHQTESYRIRTEIEREAKERAEATVEARTRELEQSNRTIEQQRQELQQQVIRLHQLLDQNESLRQRVTLASTRNTALNERFLRRLSAELHDGPAQDLAFAMINLDSGTIHAVAEQLPLEQRAKYSAELEAISAAIGRAINEVRAICSGMTLPELSHRSLSEVLARVISNHQRRTHSQVELKVEGKLEEASLPLKITLYRLVQESLNNAHKHAAGQSQAVRLYPREGHVCLEVCDQGPGFDLGAVMDYTSGLGLVGMRERVESLGGDFWIETAPGQGTKVNAILPMMPPR